MNPVTLKLYPSEWCNLDVSRGVLTVDVDVGAIWDACDGSGEKADFVTECEREEAAYWQQEFSAERTKYLNEIEKLKDRIVELETKLQELGCDDYYSVATD